MTTYVTFGSNHEYIINGFKLDNDCVAVFESNSHREGREKAFKLFNSKFCFEYYNDEFDHDTLKYFPRGLIKID